MPVSLRLDQQIVAISQIHNVFLIKGYKQDKAFIVAQSPMQSTVREFWKMIHDRQCASVVMLCEIMEDGKVSYSVH